MGNQAAPPRTQTKSRGDDRRASPRYPCPSAVCKIAPAGGKESWEARIVDLSTGGLGCYLHHEVDAGSQLDVAFPSFSRTLQLKVIHVAEIAAGTWLLGGAFLDQLSAEELRKLIP